MTCGLAVPHEFQVVLFILVAFIIVVLLVFLWTQRGNVTCAASVQD